MDPMGGPSGPGGGGGMAAGGGSSSRGVVTFATSTTGGGGPPRGHLERGIASLDRDDRAGGYIPYWPVNSGKRTSFLEPVKALEGRVLF